MTSEIQYQIDSQGVARLELCRPEKRNALTRSMLEQLVQQVEALSASGQARVLVLSAQGPAFCAGMDLGEMQQRAAADDALDQWHRDSQTYATLLGRLYSLPLPTVAAVQGPALAGGLGLVLACDLVVASDQAFFSLPEPARGITAAIVTPLLVQRVGPGAAGYLLLSMKRIDAGEALAIGLCHQVLPAGRLAGEVDQLARGILFGSRAALAATKRHLHRCANPQLEDLLRESVEASAGARASQDAREGLDAFLQRRPPAWQPPSGN